MWGDIYRATDYIILAWHKYPHLDNILRLNASAGAKHALVIAFYEYKELEHIVAVVVVVVLCSRYLHTYTV